MRRMVSFELEDDLIQRLEASCTGGESRSDALREAVKVYLKEVVSTDEIKELFRRVERKLNDMEVGNV